jgi:hypothetical protein
MSEEENKQLALRYVEAVNAGDPETLARLSHPDFFDHAKTGYAGPIEPLDIVAEDDRVVVRARTGVHIWRFSGGRIVEHWRADGTDIRGREPA